MKRKELTKKGANMESGTLQFKLVRRDSNNNLLSMYIHGDHEVKYGKNIISQAPVGGLLTYDSAYTAFEEYNFIGRGQPRETMRLSIALCQDELPLPEYRLIIGPDGTLSPNPEVVWGEIPMLICPNTTLGWQPYTRAWRKVKLIVEDALNQEEVDSFFGKTPEEKIHKAVAISFPPDVQPQALHKITSILRKGKIVWSGFPSIVQFLTTIKLFRGAVL